MLTQNSDLERIIQRVEAHHHMFLLFMEGVARFFETHPRLLNTNPPVVHSVRSRIKNLDNLRKKLLHQQDKGALITEENVFQVITDIAGVRVLHLYQNQLRDIDSAIRSHVDAGEWVFDERPKAYSWDPDATDFFSRLGLEVEIKDSHYTSVHYLVRPREDAPVCCEIQVRTLLEEVWGEIDHTVNYPTPSSSLAIKEQLRILAKLVATGSRLADAIFKLQKLEHHGQESTASDGSTKGND